MTMFPNRVWECDRDEDGNALWHSRPATPDDWSRRHEVEDVLTGRSQEPIPEAA